MTENPQSQSITAAADWSAFDLHAAQIVTQFMIQLTPTSDGSKFSEFTFFLGQPNPPALLGLQPMQMDFPPIVPVVPVAKMIMPRNRAEELYMLLGDMLRREPPPLDVITNARDEADGS